MRLAEILSPTLVITLTQASSKKKLLQDMANRITAFDPLLDTDQILDGLLTREQLGSTYLGEGVGLPHCRLSACQRLIGALVKCDRPIDWDSVDNQQADIVFILLAPEHTNQDHLDMLAEITRLLNQSAFRDAIRSTQSDEQLYKLIIEHAAN